MDAIAAYLSAKMAETAQRIARRKARRWLPALLVLALVTPLFVMTLVGSTVGTVMGHSEDQTGSLDGACTSGGAVVAGNVRATWNGLPFTAEQVSNAQTIVGVGRQKGIPPYGWLIAVTAAMTESTLNNLTHGDRDSLGLFQMRPSMGWGTPEQLTNPTYAAGKFYDVLTTTVPGWESMQVGEAAQAVERSGFPGAYQPNADVARALIQDPVVMGASCATTGGVVSGTEIQQKVVAAALSQLGMPYAWGGGDWNGPTYGIEYGSGTFGFDCSGLTGYAWYQGSGGAVAMGTFTGDQDAATVPVTKEQIQPGDLFFFPGHVGMYDGKGGMIQAPHTGAFVEVTPNIFSNSYWMGRLYKIGRPKAYLALTTNSGTGAPVAAAGKVTR